MPRSHHDGALGPHEGLDDRGVGGRDHERRPAVGSGLGGVQPDPGAHEGLENQLLVDRVPQEDRASPAVDHGGHGLGQDLAHLLGRPHPGEGPGEVEQGPRRVARGPRVGQRGDQVQGRRRVRGVEGEELALALHEAACPRETRRPGGRSGAGRRRRRRRGARCPTRRARYGAAPRPGPAPPPRRSRGGGAGSPRRARCARRGDSGSPAPHRRPVG